MNWTLLVQGFTSFHWGTAGAHAAAGNTGSCLSKRLRAKKCHCLTAHWEPFILQTLTGGSVPLHTSNTSLCPFIPQIPPCAPLFLRPWAPCAPSYLRHLPKPPAPLQRAQYCSPSGCASPGDTLQKNNRTDPACLGSLPRHTPMPPVTERALGSVALSDRGKGLPWNWARGSSSHQVQGRFSSQPSFGYRGGSAKQSYKAGQMQTFEALWPLARELCCVKSPQLTLTAMSSWSMSTQLLLEESEWEKK